jgi:hypothetical protein
MGVDIAQAALDDGHAVVATGRNTEAVTDALGEADEFLVVELTARQSWHEYATGRQENSRTLPQASASPRTSCRRQGLRPAPRDPACNGLLRSLAL